MNNQISIFLSKFNLLAGLVVLVLAIPLTAGAQQTSSTVRGSVATADGQPAAGATVTVTDTRTSASRTTTTSEDGTFNVRGLAIGGPFEIRVTSSQYKQAQVTDVYTNLSEAATFNIRLEEGEIEELYDLTADPEELENLALKPRHGARLKMFREETLKELRRTDARFAGQLSGK